MKVAFFSFLQSLGLCRTREVLGAMDHAYKDGFTKGVAAGIKIASGGNLHMVDLADIIDKTKEEKKVH